MQLLFRACFSTSRLLAKQSLFPSYTPPITKEAQHAINRIKHKEDAARRSEMQEVVRTTLNRDLAFLLPRFRPSPEELQTRRDAKIKITRAIQELAPDPARVSILDTSLNQYSDDVTSLPLELVIQDTEFPEGFPPGEAPAKHALPAFYNPNKVARALSAAGYNGTFLEGSHRDMRPIKLTSEGPPPTDRPSWDSDLRPWDPDYPVLPPSLEFKHQNLNVILYMPHPAHRALHSLLLNFSEMIVSHRALVPMFYLLLKSWYLDEISPRIVMLLVFHYFQVKLNMALTPTSSDRGFWLTTLDKDDSGNMVPFTEKIPELETGRARINTNRGTGEEFLLMLKFWDQRDRLKSLSSTQLISLRDKKFLIKRLHPIEPEKRKNEFELVEQPGMDRRLERVTHRPEPVVWRAQPIVLMDPFVITYNHAARIGWSTYKQLTRRFELTLSMLKKGKNVLTTMGPALPPIGSPPSSTSSYKSSYERYTSSPEPSMFSPPSRSSSRPSSPSRYTRSSPSRTSSSNVITPSPRSRWPTSGPENSGQFLAVKSHRLLGEAGDDEDDRGRIRSGGDANGRGRFGSGGRGDSDRRGRSGGDRGRGFHTVAGGVDEWKEFIDPPPLGQIAQNRRATIGRVAGAIRQAFGHEYRVECYGSTMYGLDTPSSDLDLVIMDLKRPQGRLPGTSNRSLGPIYDIRRVAQVLKGARFKIEEVIYQATVPIVKFTDPRTGIQCDINVNEQLGLFNTNMIACYCELFPPLRPLLRAIKKWAKSVGMNHPSGPGAPTTFSSYALTVMTIGFLQLRGYLPNLQANLMPLFSNPRYPLERQRGTFWHMTKQREYLHCDVRFHWITYPQWQQMSQIERGVVIDADVDLRELLTQWFMFWGHEFMYNTQLMSIRHGELMPRCLPPPKKKREKTKRDLKRADDLLENIKRMVLSHQEPDEGVSEVKVVGSSAEVVMERDSESATEELEVMSETAETEVFVKANPVELTEEHVSQTDLDKESATSEPPRSTDSPVQSEITTTEDPTLDASESEHESESESESKQNLEYDEAQPPRTGIEAYNDTSSHNPLLDWQEPRWLSSSMIVADPFIISKNIVGGISAAQITRFKEHCRRGALFLLNDASYEELLGEIPSTERDPFDIEDGNANASRGKGKGKGRGRGAGGRGAGALNGHHQGPDPRNGSPSGRGRGPPSQSNARLPDGVNTIPRSPRPIPPHLLSQDPDHHTASSQGNNSNLPPVVLA